MREIITFLCNNNHYALEINNVIKAIKISEFSWIDDGILLGNALINDKKTPIIDINKLYFSEHTSNELDVFLLVKNKDDLEFLIPIETIFKTYSHYEYELKEIAVDGVSNKYYSVLDNYSNKFILLDLNNEEILRTLKIKVD